MRDMGCNHFLKAICLLSYLAVAVACGSGGGNGTPPPPPDDTVDAPTGLTYSANPGQYRMDKAITPNTASLAGGDPVDSFSIAPALVAGLSFDTTTGAITGTPTAMSAATDHTITATNEGGSTQAIINIAVGAALPAAFLHLEDGFDAEVVYQDNALRIGKLARAPDGRIFFTEVDTGNIRIIDAQGNLLATPFVTVNVLTTGHFGLLGLALDPDFTTNGFVYALATVPAEGQQSDRSKIFRWTEASNVATNEMTVLDDLPIAPPGGVNNGGEILFDDLGMLFVSLGDVQTPANAQADTSTSLAGKVLRYDVSSLPATAAAGNPTANDPEWCRGLRNTFGMATHPVTGDLFGADNGPAADDELNFLAAGKNFEWENANVPPATRGLKIRNWQTVIVPTGMCWHTGVGWGTEYNNDLFIATYDHTIERFEMSGAAFVDIDDESEFAEFDGSEDNRALDICMEPDGSLLVSTFTGIYRITKP